MSYILLFNFFLPHLHAQSSENDYSIKSQDLVIEISCNHTEFIKGQLIDIIVSIKNNRSVPISLPPFDQYLYSHEDSKTYIGDRMGSQLGSADIPPFQKRILIFNPLQFINHKEDDKGFLPGLPWYYWPEGVYDFYISYKINTKTYQSNKVPIKISYVPDSLNSAFEDLKVDITNPDMFNFSTYKFESFENLFEKYRDTFYAKEFLYKLLTNWNYTYAISNKNEAETLRPQAMELYKEFILKYPNTEGAIYYFGNIYAYRDKGNEILLKEILTSLKNDDSANIF